MRRYPEQCSPGPVERVPVVTERAGLPLRGVLHRAALYARGCGNAVAEAASVRPVPGRRRRNEAAPGTRFSRCLNVSRCQLSEEDFQILDPAPGFSAIAQFSAIPQDNKPLVIDQRYFGTGLASAYMCSVLDTRHGPKTPNVIWCAV